MPVMKYYQAIMMRLKPWSGPYTIHVVLEGATPKEIPFGIHRQFIGQKHKFKKQAKAVTQCSSRIQWKKQTIIKLNMNIQRAGQLFEKLLKIYNWHTRRKIKLELFKKNIPCSIKIRVIRGLTSNEEFSSNWNEEKLD